MAIGAITMILTNVGLQIYNNWCGSRQNAKLQQKREEFERAARDRNTEHMWKLLREGQELAMQLEKEKHKDRLRELRKEADHLLQRRIHEDTIRNWPLRVLPIVMMNRRFGNLLANQVENVVMHVILTRSNYAKFNTSVYPIIEKQLEQYCDKHWSTMSDHPVLFYSGAWKSMTSPTTPQIDALRGELASLPTLLITPFFRPYDGKLVFRLNMWGVGANSTDPFDVPEIEPKSDEFHFQRTYTNEQDYDKEVGLLDEIVEDLVPYLECMIGYMADTYFWASSGFAPHLPVLVTNGTINTDGMKYLISDSREYYNHLYLESARKSKENPFAQINLSILYQGVSLLESKVFHSDSSCEEDKLNSITIMRTYMENKRIKLNGDLYSVKRDELLKLLNDTLEIPYLPEDTKREFLRIHKKCLENQYSLILIGEFQGGKSTTFDALCGGREISPRGALTKTSACKITATNLSSKEDEYADLHWKTREELILGIQSVFSKRISKKDLGLSENEIFTPNTHLNFENPKHVQLMRKAIEQEWDFLEKNQNVKDYEDQLEIVKIADLILTFFDNPVVVQNSKRITTTIEEISKLIVFPDSWDKNWESGKNGAQLFKPEEVLFAFIAKVDCHIHSKQLERLGCSIVDCPGLFASAWDTKVAQETIPEGDAILYLLGGEKQMTDGDKRALREIKADNPSINNIFFAINQKQNETITQNFVPRNISTLKGLGFNIDNLSVINALLFYLGQFGIGYLAGGIDNHTIERFNILAEKFGYKNLPICDIWCKMVRKIGVTIDDDELLLVKELSNDNASVVLRRSGQQPLFSEIEEFIIENKAYSILIENGANKAFDAIASFEDRLKQKEEDAQKTTAQRQAEFQKRKEIYNQFIDETKFILKESFPKNVIAPIVNNAFMAIFQDSETVNRIALKCSVALLPAMKSGDVYMAAIKYKTNKFFDRNDAADIHQQKIKDAIKPIFKNNIEEVLNGKMNTWIAQLKSGKSPDFEMYFLPELERIKSEINQKWTNVISKCPELRGYDIDCTTSTLSNLPSPDVSLDTTDAIGEFVVTDTISDLLRILIGMIANIITVWVLDGILTGGILIIVGMIVQLVISFSGGSDDEEKFSREELNKKEQKLYDAIQSNIYSTFAAPDFREKILWGKNGLVNVPYQFVNQYKQYYSSQLSEKAKKLEDDIIQAEKEFAGAREKLERIAEDAKQQRENYVHPLSVKINSFIKSITNG